eukprot:Opistho-2@69723
MSDLVTDHHANAAVVAGVIGLRVEEGRLKDAGREGDLVQATGRGVDDIGRHAPARTVHRAVQVTHLARRVPGIGAQRIAGVVVGPQAQPFIAGPLGWRTDLGRHLLQLVDGLELRGGAHPAQVLDARAHGTLDVGQQLQRAHLCLGREGLADEDLAQGQAQWLAPGAAANGHDHAFGPCRRLLQAADGRVAVGEVGVGEGLGQAVGAAVQQAQLQIGPPGGDRRAARQQGQALGELGLCHDQALHALRTAGQRKQIGLPVEAWRDGGQLGGGEGVVTCIGVAQLGARLVGLGQAGFESQQVVDARIRGLGAGGIEQAAGIEAVSGLDAVRHLVILEVVVAVRQAQAGLAQGQHIAARVLGVGPHTHAQRRGHLHAVQCRQQDGQLFGCAQCVDTVQQRLQCLQPGRLDGGLVHAAGEVGGGLLQARCGLQGGLGHQLAQGLLQDGVTHVLCVDT